MSVLLRERVSPDDSTQSLAERLASLPPSERADLIDGLSDQEADELLYDWSFWARPSQIAPDGDWSTWLILAGRGFGKTRTGAEWVRDQAALGPQRLALVAPTAADARKVMVEGESGILAISPPTFRPLYQPSQRQLTWPNGAIAILYSAEEPERLRGPQHHAAWCDELAAWKYLRDTWDMLQFGLRLGFRPRQVVTTTPKPLAVLKEIIADRDTVVTRGSTFENIKNLAPAFTRKIVAKYEGTRLGRQELGGELLEDVAGALWSRANIDRLRVRPNEVPELTRIVIAIDPATSTNENSNETGIIAAGIGVDGHGYVLEDASGAMKPGGEEGWAAQAVALFKARKADRIVAEVNNGGNMVETTVRVVDPNVPYKAVHASRGKQIRAEPISALYEQGRVHHVGSFPNLEDQMCAFTHDYDRERDGSPDRMDALVWALTELAIPEGTMAFGASERDILGAPFDLPRHWPRCFALDIDRNRVAAAFAAHDKDTDTVWIYATYTAQRGDLGTHAAALKDRTKQTREMESWIPGVFDHKARGRKAEEGERIVDRLLDFRIDLFVVEADPETAVQDMTDRLGAKRLHVFASCTDWLTEYRGYRRDKKDDLPDAEDGLMRATGLLCLHGLQIAATDAALGRETDEAWADESRSETTGY